jgi:hypothetical protein
LGEDVLEVVSDEAFKEIVSFVVLDLVDVLGELEFVPDTDSVWKDDFDVLGAIYPESDH